MSASQRRKGAAGERELFKLLSAELGTVVSRNLTQTRAGGADCIDVSGWSVECKRAEDLKLATWWAQAQTQADAAGACPVLFYRRSRHPWAAVFDLSDLMPESFPKRGDTCEMSLPAACQLIRERLSVPVRHEREAGKGNVQGVLRQAGAAPGGRETDGLEASHEP